MKPTTKRTIKALWGADEVTEHVKYLGLLQLVGKGKGKIFSKQKQRVWKRLQEWKEKLVSQVKKEIIIKAVALSVPTYTMSCFQLPHSICDELGKMMARFWWGQRKEKNKIH